MKPFSNSFTGLMPHMCRILLVTVIASGTMFTTEMACAQDVEKDVIYPGQESEKLSGPLIEEDPFDLIFLGNDDENAILRIMPLLRPHQKPYPSRGMFRFEFKHESDNEFQVPWDQVTNYKTFNQLLIEEANAWLANGDYPKAFRNLLYVYDHGGKADPNIRESLQKCMYLDGKANFENENYELALSIFEDMYAENPKFRVPGINRSLSQIIMACYEGILRRNFDGGNIIRVRGILAQISKTYKEESESLVESWRGRFAKRSDELIQQAFEYMRNGDGVKAHDAVRMANNIFPGRQENTDAYNEVVKQHPLIFVGVAQGPGDANPARMDHWGARRIGRLTQRTIVEFTGLSDEGGKYKFLPGTITQTDESGLEFRLDINPNNEGFAIPEMTAADVALRLQSYADPGSPNYYVPWAKVLRSISIKSPTEVNLKLRTPFVRPESHFQIPLFDRDENGQPLQNGPYVMIAVKDDLTLYELNPMYSPSTDRQHPKIYERKFDSSSDAVDALLKGDIDVVDRVPIQNLAELKMDPDITVQEYTVPTVHMLVPNQRNDFMKDSNFRNGLLHAINRELIVSEMICGGQEVSGCQVISGPFPIGSEENDQLAYGYNPRVRNAEYNFKLGLVLAQLITETLKDRAAKEEFPTEVVRPPIVLAHPTDDVSMLACRAIARMWSEIGIKVLLKPIENDGTLPTDEDWDFLYLSASMQEPMVDAIRLFGQGGYVETIDAPTKQSLKYLSMTNSWQKGCLSLRQIHQQTANSLSVLPLWQITEYYAHRSTVREVGSDLVHLYQDIERWRIAPIQSESQEPQPNP